MKYEKEKVKPVISDENKEIAKHAYLKLFRQWFYYVILYVVLIVVTVAVVIPLALMVINNANMPVLYGILAAIGTITWTGVFLAMIIPTFIRLMIGTLSIKGFFSPAIDSYTVTTITYGDGHTVTTDDAGAVAAANLFVILFRIMLRLLFSFFAGPLTPFILVPIKAHSIKKNFGVRGFPFILGDILLVGFGGFAYGVMYVVLGIGFVISLFGSATAPEMSNEDKIKMITMSQDYIAQTTYHLTNDQANVDVRYDGMDYFYSFSTSTSFQGDYYADAGEEKYMVHHDLSYYLVKDDNGVYVPLMNEYTDYKASVIQKTLDNIRCYETDLPGMIDDIDNVSAKKQFGRYNVTWAGKSYTFEDYKGGYRLTNYYPNCIKAQNSFEIHYN